PGVAQVIESFTYGHRFLAPEKIKVKHFVDYKKQLELAHVLLDPADRRAKILKDAEALAKQEGLTLKPDEGLLNEVAGLVEWPVVLMGTIDGAFMDLPDEVLSTTMRTHQKYFSLLDGDGKLAPRFIVVANTEASDGGKAITAGNERVLRARLSDARHFWDRDRKQSLESHLPALEKIVFHAKLGTVAEKVSRMEALVQELAWCIPGVDTALAQRAALLCKCDLVSEMVYEFPELQGIMGRYYALNEGARPEVADAVAEHYSPAGPNDMCPSAPVSVAVALADKLDTLTGFWAIDEKPTGSKDPFALRRAALGVIRLIVENGLRIPLLKIFGKAREGSDGADLLAFFADRLKVHLKEKGVKHDHVDAVFALGGEDDLVRLLARVDALGKFLDTDDGANLLTAYKRAANILKIEEKKDKKQYNDDPAISLLGKGDEESLFNSLMEIGPKITKALNEEKFSEAMGLLATVRPQVDSFFDNVTVNCDDLELRENRLNLLSYIRRALDKIADFSKIEG
ncbi:MAG: glycine--tRNA ligase subunit beta, partial [Rhodospirillales bacterium]|nr:glycine--tRNA ligase subunit beta [Rhodospirillales bacterium]